MNAAPDVVSLLQQLLLQQSQQAGPADSVLSALSWFFRSTFTGFGTAIIVGIILLAALVLVYRPRLSRGALWVPAFGLFGGAPTLYLHTRPASYGGVFSHSRRLKHRGFLFFRKASRNH